MSLLPTFVLNNLDQIGTLILIVLYAIVYYALRLRNFHLSNTDLDELTKPGLFCLQWNEARFGSKLKLYDHPTPKHYQLRIVLDPGSIGSIRRLRRIVAANNLKRRTGRIVEVAIRWDALIGEID